MVCRAIRELNHQIKIDESSRVLLADYVDKFFSSRLGAPRPPARPPTAPPRPAPPRPAPPRPACPASPC